MHLVAFGSIWKRLDVFEKFQDLSQFSRGVSKFSQVFRSFRTCVDPFGPIRIHSDAFGCFRRRSEVFGRLQKFSTFLAFSSDFCRLGVAIIGE